jgi:hypothetical protein
MPVGPSLRALVKRSTLARRAWDTAQVARGTWARWPRPFLPAHILIPPWPNEPPEPTFPGLTSQAVTDMQLRSPEYRAWVERLHQPKLHVHRKQWEWFFVVQALAEAGVVVPGARGIGFGVGTEPLTPWFASQGCTVLATDHPGGEHAADWSKNGELARSLDDLNAAGICDPEGFGERVSFRPVDMRDLRGIEGPFDFAWSSCAFEHLGSIAAGLDFLEAHLDLLRPGGVGVHTTELCVSSATETVDHASTVLFRRSDLEGFARRIAPKAEVAPLNFHLGGNPNDHYVAPEHVFTRVMLKFAQGPHATTSYGVIIRKR